MLKETTLTLWRYWLFQQFFFSFFNLNLCQWQWITKIGLKEYWKKEGEEKEFGAVDFSVLKILCQETKEQLREQLLSLEWPESQGFTRKQQRPCEPI